MDSASGIIRQAAKHDVILFLSQIAVVFLVVLASLINLTLFPSNETRGMWVNFLTVAFAFIAPNPRVKLEAISQPTKELSSSEPLVSTSSHSK